MIEDVLVDYPTTDQIRVRMMAAGVCASDGHVVWGEETLESKPFVLGHEGSAVVESVGSNVSKVKPGDHVLLSYLAECGNCATCVNSLSNLCLERRSFSKLPNKRLLNGTPVYGMGGSGLFAEYVLIHQAIAVKVVYIDYKSRNTFHL